MKSAEAKAWDKRVIVRFQSSAWADEEIMLNYLNNEWKTSVDLDPGSFIVGNKKPQLRILDVHKAQKTEKFKSLTRELNTFLVMVPGGCTSLVQPLDIMLNKPFKNRVEAIALDHYIANLDL